MPKYKKATVAEEGQKLTWTFANGKVLTIDVGSLPSEIMLKAAVHGVRQKGSDCYAGDESADTAYDSCKEVLETLVAGTWNTKREAGEKASPLFDEALARYFVKYPHREAPIRKGLAEGITTPQGEFKDAEVFKKMLRDATDIKSLIADIQKERADKAAAAEGAKNVDALIGV